jgi:hypothetical protein
LLQNDDDSAITTATALSTDGQILLDFKSSIADENGLLQDWLESDVHPCAWTGVTCDHTSKSVTGIPTFFFFIFILLHICFCFMNKLDENMRSIRLE